MMQIQIRHGEATYDLVGLDHETMRILDAACASLTDNIAGGFMRAIDRKKLATVFQLILDATSGCHGDVVHPRTEGRHSR